MPTEMRSALPYFSHIIITKRPTQKFVPTGYTTDNGQEILQRVTDVPGVQVEITPFLNDKACTPVTFVFTSREFIEEELSKYEEAAKQLAAIRAKPVEQVTDEEKLKLPTLQIEAKQNEQAVTQMKAILASKDNMWVEDVLKNVSGLPSFADMWEDIFSDALDMFPSWAETTNAVGGVDVTLHCMQWNARMPATGDQSIELKAGAYTVGSEVPTVFELIFESDVAKANREAEAAQDAATIERIDKDLALSVVGSQRYAELTNERAGVVVRQQQRASVERRLLSDVLTKQSVKTSLPGFLLAACMHLKDAGRLPNLDMAVVEPALVARFKAMVGETNGEPGGQN